MPQSNQLAKWIILLLLLSLIAWGFFSSIEFYDDQQRSGWSSKALTNPYLAATYFLEQSDIKVVEADSLLKLNSLKGVSTVLITDANQVVNARQLEEVLDWLKKGGNLIVTANHLNNEDDLLLEKFDVSVEWRSPDLKQGEDKPLSKTLRDYNEKLEQGMSEDEIIQSILNEEFLTQIKFGEEIGVLSIAFNTNRILKHPNIDDKDAIVVFVNI